MEKRTPPRPTDTELEILRVLWQQGPSTVRQAHEELTKSRFTGYTTTLKMLQIMTAKGLVERDDSQRTHVYTACLTQQQTQRHLISDLLSRAFDGSARKLVVQALSAEKISPRELDQIRRLLDELEGETGNERA